MQDGYIPQHIIQRGFCIETTRQVYFGNEVDMKARLELFCNGTNN